MSDPYLDFMRHDSDREDEIAKRPICDCCGEHIQTEKAVHIMGFWFCEDCIDDNEEYL